jgi:hypothetical protein
MIKFSSGWLKIFVQRKSLLSFARIFFLSFVDLMNSKLTRYVPLDVVLEIKFDMKDIEIY